MKTLNDLIDQYPLSRITLERRMRKIPDFRKKYCKHGKYGKLLINEKGEELITGPKHDTKSGNFVWHKGPNKSQRKIAALKKEIAHYKGQRDTLIVALRKSNQRNDQLLSNNNHKAANSKKQQTLVVRKPTKSEQELGYIDQPVPSADEWNDKKKEAELLSKQNKLLRNESFGQWLQNKFLRK